MLSGICRQATLDLYTTPGELDILVQLEANTRMICNWRANYFRIFFDQV